MATAKKLKSGNWRVQVFSHEEHVFDDNNKPIIDNKTNKQKKRRIYESFTADSKKEAEYLAADFSLNKQRLRNTKRYTVNEAIDKYIDSKNNVLSPTTLRGYKTLRNNSFNDICDIQISKLTPELIQNWINALSVGHKPKTVRNAHGLLSAVLNMFLPQVRLYTTLPMSVAPDLYTPSDSDIMKLLKHIEDTELEKAVLLGAFGMMRRGEIAALTAEDISGTTVTINKSMVRNNTGGFIVKSPKTASSFRKEVLPDFVIKKISNTEGRIVKIHPEDITKRFGKAIKELGLPHFRFHDLRHYSASIMHAMGVPDQYIMQRGGWKTDRVLKAVYRNVINDENKKFTDMTNSHFQKMQHEMQHKK